MSSTASPTRRTDKDGHREAQIATLLFGLPRVSVYSSIPIIPQYSRSALTLYFKVLLHARTTILAYGKLRVKMSTSLLQRTSALTAIGHLMARFLQLHSITAKSYCATKMAPNLPRLRSQLNLFGVFDSAPKSSIQVTISLSAAVGTKSSRSTQLAVAKPSNRSVQTKSLALILVQSASIQRASTC